MNKIIDFEKQARGLGIMIDEIKLIQNALKNCRGELFLIGEDIHYFADFKKLSNISWPYSLAMLSG